jgi:hypothetical protein
MKKAPAADRLAAAIALATAWQAHGAAPSPDTRQALLDAIRHARSLGAQLSRSEAALIRAPRQPKVTP